MLYQPEYLKKIGGQGLERWLSNFRLLLQRPGVQVSAPKSGCSQVPLTPTQGDQNLSSDLHEQEKDTIKFFI